jgi:chromosome segregation ATPase
MRRLQGRAAFSLAVLLALVLSASGVAWAAEVSFKDAPASDHWAGAALDEMDVGKILIGYPDGTFKGEQATTRYELAMALSRLYALVREVMKRETVDPQALAQLAGEVQALRAELDRRSGALDQQVGALDKQVRSQDQRQARVEARLDGTEAELEKLQGGVAGLGRRVNGLEDRLGLADSRSGALEGRVEQAETRVGALEKDRVTPADLTDVQRKLEELAAAVQRRQQELQQQLQAAATQEEVQGRLARQDAALEMLREGLTQTAGQLSQAVADLADQRTAAEALADQRKAAEALADSRSGALEGRVEQAEARVGTLEKDRVTPADLTEVQRSLGELVSTVQRQLEDRLGLADNRSGALEGRVEQAEARVGTLEKDRVTAADLTDVQRKLEELAAAVQRRQQELQQQLQAAATQEEVQGRLARQDAALEMLRTSLTQTAGQLSQAVADLADQQKAAEALADQRKAAEALADSRSGALEGWVEQAEARVGTLEKDRVTPADLTEVQRKLEELAAEAQGRLARQDAAVEMLRTSLAQTAGQLSQAVAALADQRKAGEGLADNRSGALEGRVEQAETRVGVLETDRVTPADLTDVQRKLEELAAAVQRRQQELQQQLLAAATQEEVQGRLARQDAAVEMLRKSLAQTAGQLSQAVADLADQRKAAEALADQRSGALEGRVEQAEARVGTLEKDRVTPADMTDVQRKLEELVAEAQGRLARQDAAVEMLRESLAQTAGQLSQAVADLADQRKAGEDLAAQLLDLRKALDPLGLRLAELRLADEALAKRLSTVEGRTEELAKADTALTGRLQQNQQASEDLRQRVETLEEEAKKLKESQRRMGWLIALGAAVIAVF